MELPIISTKLNVPGLCSHQIPRPGLLQLLDKSVEYKLTLVCAPAGFGKSALASAWTSGRDKIGWLSLDDNDNDPVSFFSHFFYGINRIIPGLATSALSALQERDSVDYNSLVFSLINDINEFDDSIFFILDDYHLIEEELIHKSLQLLLDRMPGQLHLIILTRSDPPFSLAKLRSSEQLCEIRAKDLEFDLAETESFLNEKWLLNIGADDIRYLHDRTEGWVTGLQLSAFSLNKTESKSDFIQSLNGDDRYIADYLAEQVLNSLSERLMNFLLQISVLNRLCGSLTDFVTGENNTGDLLVQMEKDNLFLIPLDNQRKWFRLHHLFSELLRQRLTGQNQDLQVLHSRASDWFDSNGYPVEAIDQAIKSGNSERIISFIEKYANDFLMIRGETKNLLNWLKRIPEELVYSSARLNLTYAWVLFFEFALPQITPYLENVEKLLEFDDDNDIRAEYEAVLATVAVLKGELDQSVEKFRYALQIISPGNKLMRGVILFGLGYGCITIGQLNEADKILDEAGIVNRENGNVSISLKAYCFLAICRILAGKNRDARYAVSVAFELAKGSGLDNAPVMSLAYSIFAELEREENNLIAAAESSSRAIEISQKHNDLPRLFTAYIIMAAIKETQQLYTGALSCIDKAEELIKGKAAYLSTFRVESVRRRLLIKMNSSIDDEMRKPDDKWLSLSGVIMIPGQVCEFEHLTYVRNLISEEKYSEAETMLNFLMAQVDDTEKELSKIEILFHKMIIQLKKGNRSEGQALFLKLAVSSEKTGNLAIFLESPQIIEPVLQEVISEKGKGAVSTGFLKRLSGLLKTAGHKQSTPELIIPLSEREREVLLLLDTDMTNREIAEKLFVSINTLKTHIKNINNKLDTSNRKEAAIIARKIGLL